jgi:rare lipoprotein A (peptidoglycan hydrolase)
MVKTIIFIGIILFSASFLAGQEKGYAINYKESDASRVTSSSELYDPSKLTAAHNSLPIGTMVNVSRLDNGVSVVVRINDRGPFIPNRILALSKAAAITLGLKKYEKIYVQLYVIPKKEPQESIENKSNSKPEIPFYQPGSTNLPSKLEEKYPVKQPLILEEKNDTDPLSAPTQESFISTKAESGTLIKGVYQIQLNKIPEKGFAIQIGSYQQIAILWKEIAKLHNAWFKHILIQSIEMENGTIAHKLMLGPFPTKEKAMGYKGNL